MPPQAAATLARASSTASQLTAAGDDAASEAASELGRGSSRLSVRYELGSRADGDEVERKGSLKGMFRKAKKSKQIELDALRQGRGGAAASA